MSIIYVLTVSLSLVSHGSESIDNARVTCKVKCGKQKGGSCYVRQLHRLSHRQTASINSSGARSLQHPAPAEQSTFAPRRLSVADPSVGNKHRKFWRTDRQKHLGMSVPIMRRQSERKERWQRARLR